MPLSLKLTTQQGKASYYADSFKGNKTANGEIYDPKKFTAAHRTLPFGTRVRVTNLFNDKSVVVRINDRGPFIKSRIIDLSRAAAEQLGIIDSGVAEVLIEVLK
ncbi:MAG: septal ring lytic transglycosylase RlpA family protein [Calditrichaeota bacterium]|nr:septal ring lytic transglycosylase RlpA family protein [Calditrichota bacterium]